MRQSDSWASKGAGIAGLSLAFGGFVLPAAAQTTDVFNGASFVADGLTFSVAASTCEQNFNAGKLTSCSSTSNARAEFLPSVGIRGATFTLANSGNSGQTKGTGLFSTVSATGDSDQLEFTLDATSTKTLGVSTAILTVATTGSLGTGGSLTVSESGFPAGFNNSTLSLSAAGTMSTTASSNYVGTLAIAYDIQLIEGSGGTLKLTSVQSIFNPAPEPLSIAVFGVGLAGLAAARRSRAKDKDGATD
jgi:hypothetical protein